MTTTIRTAISAVLAAAAAAASAVALLAGAGAAADAMAGGDPLVCQRNPFNGQYVCVNRPN